MGRFVSAYTPRKRTRAKYRELAVFSALRVHALSQRNWYLTSFTFFWSFLAFPVDYYVSRIVTFLVCTVWSHRKIGRLPSSVLYPRPCSRMHIWSGNI